MNKFWKVLLVLAIVLMSVIILSANKPEPPMRYKIESELIHENGMAYKIFILRDISLKYTDIEVVNITKEKLEIQKLKLEIERLKR